MGELRRNEIPDSAIDGIQVAVTSSKTKSVVWFPLDYVTRARSLPPMHIPKFLSLHRQACQNGSAITSEFISVLKQDAIARQANALNECIARNYRVSDCLAKTRTIGDLTEFDVPNEDFPESAIRRATEMNLSRWKANARDQSPLQRAIRIHDILLEHKDGFGDRMLAAEMAFNFVGAGTWENVDQLKPAVFFERASYYPINQDYAAMMMLHFRKAKELDPTAFAVSKASSFFASLESAEKAESERREARRKAYAAAQEKCNGGRVTSTLKCIREADWEIPPVLMRMAWPKAVAYCQQKGMRLPTAEEFYFGIALFPKVVLEKPLAFWLANETQGQAAYAMCDRMTDCGLTQAGDYRGAAPKDIPFYVRCIK